MAGVRRSEGPLKGGTAVLLKPHTRSHKHLEIPQRVAAFYAINGSNSQREKIGSYSIAFKLDAVKYHLDGHTQSDTSRYCFMLPPPPFHSISATCDTLQDAGTIMTIGLRYDGAIFSHIVMHLFIGK